MTIGRFQILLLLVVFAPLAARASGDEVVVIYNSRLPESKAVAEYYARARQVPDWKATASGASVPSRMPRPTASPSA